VSVAPAAREVEAPRTHPAARAWTVFGGAPPSDVEPLKEGSNSAAYRLRGIVDGHPDVVAKRAPANSVERERLAYTAILPGLDRVAVAEYFGDVDDADGSGWIFLEDLGAEMLRSTIERMASPIAELVGRIHASFDAAAEAHALPNHPASYYLGLVSSATATLTAAADRPSLSLSARATVLAVRAQLERLDDAAGLVTESSARAPATLLHGDLALKHFRCVGDNLAIIDWENVAVGCPAVDLFALDHLGPGARIAYQECVGDAWGVTAPDTDRLFVVGRVLRALQSLEWELSRVTDRMSGRTEARLGYIADELRDALRSLRA
jgi:aminoglycoside phosphotransferase (APT) family kinase protein